MTKVKALTAAKSLKNLQSLIAGQNIASIGEGVKLWVTDKSIEALPAIATFALNGKGALYLRVDIAGEKKSVAGAAYWEDIQDDTEWAVDDTVEVMIGRQMINPKLTQGDLDRMAAFNDSMKSATNGIEVGSDAKRLYVNEMGE
jgi:hypothetical protein